MTVAQAAATNSEKTPPEEELSISYFWRAMYIKMETRSLSPTGAAHAGQSGQSETGPSAKGGKYHMTQGLGATSSETCHAANIELLGRAPLKYQEADHPGAGRNATRTGT